MSEENKHPSSGSSKIIPIGIGLLALCWVTILAFKDKGEEAPPKTANTEDAYEMQRPANRVPGVKVPNSNPNRFANAPKPGYQHPRVKRETEFDRHQEIQAEDPFKDQPESMETVSLNRSLEAQLAFRKTASNPPLELRKKIKAPAKGWQKPKARPAQLPDDTMNALNEMAANDDLELMLEQQAESLREAFYNQGEEYDGPSLTEIEDMEKKKYVISF